MFDIYATSACYELVHVQTAMAVANMNSNANDMNNNEIKNILCSCSYFSYCWFLLVRSTTSTLATSIFICYFHYMVLDHRTRWCMTLFFFRVFAFPTANMKASTPRDKANNTHFIRLAMLPIARTLASITTGNRSHPRFKIVVSTTSHSMTIDMK